MEPGPVWIPHGTWLSTLFETRDVRIPGLRDFVTDMASALGDGKPIAVSAREAAHRHPEAKSAFDLESDDAAIEESFGLKEHLAFTDEPLPYILQLERPGRRLRLRLTAELATGIRALLAMCSAGRWAPHEIRRGQSDPVLKLFDALVANGIVTASDKRPNIRRKLSTGPSVTRLQHAGLLYRGRHAGILVDPHFQSSFEPRSLRNSLHRCEFEGLVDAIIISHSHGDHFHLPTLMSFPVDTMIVVPKVPRETMLCPNFGRTLRALGFTHVVELGWNDEPIRVGDLEVHALPFYGEQPMLSEAWRHPDLRNHGNTYVIQHESFTSWFMIDSGNDITGRMSDVAHNVKARFGRIDLLLSNLREFSLAPGPLYITGGGHYWLSLRPDQMVRFAAMRDDVITLSPEGVAEVCGIVNARLFLPYAHWWNEVGEPHGELERALSNRLSSHLAALGATTDVYPWVVGDTWEPR